jgi:hypothetical protein
MSSQFPQQRPNSPTNSDMRFFPPNMYDPQINMIRKPFVLNKEKLRQDFNSPKYENRRKEFFATFSEFLRSYIRDKYYEFMNYIQTEVNFFEWFDHYYKPKILAGRNTNTNSLQNLQRKTIPTYSYKTRQDTIIQNKTNTFQPTTPTLPLLNQNHANNTTHANSASILSLTSGNILLATKQQDKHSMTSLTSKYQFNNNTHLDKKQNILSQYGQINTIKKNKKDNIKKDKKKPNKDIGSLTKEKLVDTLDPLTKIPKEKAKHKPLCYKCNKLGHYQNNCKPPKNKSKLNIPEFHSEINSLKQEIKEIKNSSFQITEEQLAQEIVTLNMNDNHLQDSNIENEVEPEENCKQIVQSITQPIFKENFLNTIDKMLFQKWYT